MSKGIFPFEFNQVGGASVPDHVTNYVASVAHFILEQLPLLQDHSNLLYKSRFANIGVCAKIGWKAIEGVKVEYHISIWVWVDRVRSEFAVKYVPQKEQPVAEEASSAIAPSRTAIRYKN